MRASNTEHANTKRIDSQALGLGLGLGFLAGVLPIGTSKLALQSGPMSSGSVELTTSSAIGDFVAGPNMFSKKLAILLGPREGDGGGRFPEERGARLAPPLHVGVAHPADAKSPTTRGESRKVLRRKSALE